jgi:5S rRNA maturation endonuclease (ribonuclease M5)
MRDEILKIGKKNNVIVSTHSQNMVDTSTPERHWIVQKQKSETSILQINTNTPIEDDKVLASAFGINLFKELLPKNIIIVEGGDDKNIISHALKLIKDKFFYSIKSAGGASKSPAFARLLSDENVPAYLLFDSDKDGRDNKKKILDNQKEFYSTNNVFTLKDLNNDIPKDSTIEDVLPLDFVKSFFDKEMETSFNLVSDRGILHQIKNQNQKLKSDKQKLDSLKIKLSKEFVETYNTKSKIKGMDRLIGMIEKLVDKIELEE